MDKWKPIDVNEWVFNTVNSKPDGINGYVDRLYEEHKTESGSEKEPITVLLFADLHVDY